MFACANTCLHTKFDLMELSTEEDADGYLDKTSFPVLITLHTFSCLNCGCIPLDFKHQETRHLYLSGKLLLHCIKGEQHSQMVIHLKHHSNLSWRVSLPLYQGYREFRENNLHYLLKFFLLTKMGLILSWQQDVLYQTSDLHWMNLRIWDTMFQIHHSLRPWKFVFLTVAQCQWSLLQEALFLLCIGAEIWNLAMIVLDLVSEKCPIFYDIIILLCYLPENIPYFLYTKQSQEIPFQVFTEHLNTF